MKNAAPNSIAGASTLTGLSKGSGSGTSAMPTFYEMHLNMKPLCGLKTI